MEISETLARVVGRHVVLVAALVVAGLLGAVALHVGDPAQYSASARIVLGTSDPSSQAQSTAVADTAGALATGPGLVATAIQQTGVHRDPAVTAQSHVSVASLGSSGLSTVTVTDPDPRVATDLADRVAADVVSTYRSVTSGDSASLLAGIASRRQSTQAAIGVIDGQLATLGEVDAQQSPLAVPLVDRPWTRSSTLLRQRDDLTQTLRDLDAEQASVEAAQAQRLRGTVVDQSAVAVAVPSRVLPDAGLGALLGLVVGLALAATSEAVRPTLVGRDAISRNLGAPVLAELHGEHDSESAVAEAAMHIELAASGAYASNVGLLALDREMDLLSLARRLGHGLEGLDVQVVGGRPSALPEGQVTGVVVVAPKVVRVNELDRIVEFFTISGWPLLGLIVLDRQRGLPRLPARHTDRPPVEQVPTPTPTARP